jgi:hypothetical protein
MFSSTSLFGVTWPVVLTQGSFPPLAWKLQQKLFVFFQSSLQDVMGRAAVELP